jgi:hypothetical protein
MTVSIGGATVSGGVTIGDAIVPIVTSGLVLSLDAGNSSSYPGTGSTWTDLSGSVNTGTLFNSPVYSSANGGYLDFDGIDDYASGANSVSTDLTGDMSCEVWFKLDAVAADWVRPFGKGDITNRTYGLWYNTLSPGYFLYQRYGTSNFGAQVNTMPIIGQWYQMVGTSTGSNHVLYINGVSVATATATGPWASSTEGYRVAAATFHTFHNGPLSIARLYNRGLTAAEVSQNFNVNRGRYGL